jgi:LytS/YehU family sensor histidine kinase
MKTGILNFSKQVIILLAILIGLLISLDQWVIIFRHINEPDYPTMKGLRFILSQTIYLVLLAWILWHINIFSKIKSWKWKWLLSFLISLVFISAATLVEPYSNELNNYPHEHGKGSSSHSSGETQNRAHNEKEEYYYDDWDEWAIKTIIIFFICTISGSVYELIRRNAEYERDYEKLRNEALQSKLNTLTNQINPHFFFNSLNSLYSLVFNDHKLKSLEYITKMSGVFRYILQNEEKRLVPLKKEMDFLDTYLFMLTVKYDKKLSVTKAVGEDYYSYQLPVLSILPLIENVIKHNEISNQYPMNIDVYIDKEERLSVSNPKRERLDVAMSGTGLKNLNNRFLLITGKEIAVENTDETFTVRLPLIKTEKA